MLGFTTKLKMDSKNLTSIVPISTFQQHSNDEHHADAYEKQNKPSNNYRPAGMCLMISVHQLLGISFFGSGFRKKFVGIIRAMLAIALNCAVIVFALHNYCNSNQSESSNAFLRKSTSPALTYIRAISLGIYFLSSYVQNIYMSLIGRRMFRLIADELIDSVDPDVEKRIGRNVLTVQLSVVVAMNALFSFLLYLQFGEIVWDRSIENFFNLYSSTTPIVWLCYMNTVLSTIARKSAGLRDMNCYVETLLKIGQLVNRITSMLAPSILLSIFNSMIVCIAATCMLVVDFRQTYFIAITGFVDYSILMLMLVFSACKCYEDVQQTSSRFEFVMYRSACDSEQSNSFGSFILNEDQRKKKLEEGCHRGIGGHNISSELMMLNNLSQQIQMQPMGLFSLTRSYLVTFYAFMLSYSVILVQTSESQVRDK